MRLILLALFLISLFPKNVDLDSTLELRPLVFAVLVCSLILIFGLSVWRKKNHPGTLCPPSLQRWGIKLKFSAIDYAYASCFLLTVVSLVFVSGNVNAFHYAFVACGMLVIYFFIRVKVQNEKIYINQRSEGLKVECQERINKSPLSPLQKGESFQARRLNYILKKEWLIFFIVGIGFVNALIGLVQFFCGKDVVGTFGYSSFFCCFLAVSVPIVFGVLLAIWNTVQLSKVEGQKRLNLLLIFFILAVLLMIGVVVLTKSRTAMIGLGVVLPLMLYFYHKGTETRRIKLITNYRLLIMKIIVVIVLLLVILFSGRIFYELKPMSASGRVLIWKVSADMFFKNPISGVGFGNFANSYNLYQADYFASGKGSVINKMTAGQVRHAYNWYLETAAEFGVFGLIVFGIFWCLILKEVYKVFAPPRSPSTPPRQGGELTGRGSRASDYVTLGMAGAVLCFMIMCLFQFPNKIIPTYLIFNVALAWIVNANLEENSKTQIIPQHTRGKNNKQIPKEENK